MNRYFLCPYINQPPLIAFLSYVVDFLAEQYIEAEQTYTIEEGEKVVSVIVDRTMYSLSPEAMELFERIHDGWKLDICEKYPHDVLIGGRIICYLTLRCSPYPWIYMIKRKISFFPEVRLCSPFNKLYKYQLSNTSY